MDDAPRAVAAASIEVSGLLAEVRGVGDLLRLGATSATVQRAAAALGADFGQKRVTEDDTAHPVALIQDPVRGNGGSFGGR